MKRQQVIRAAAILRDIVERLEVAVASLQAAEFANRIGTPVLFRRAEREDFEEGVVRMWAQDYDDQGEAGLVPIPVAVVEAKDGYCFSVPVEWLRFEV